ncbi:hypothetical protein V1515DRAFT_624471 [Lipomyces mesembrius]
MDLVVNHTSDHHSWFQSSPFFSTVTPWIEVNEDYKEWNAKFQVNDPSSVYAHWHSMFRLRREFKDVLVYGKFGL